MTEEQARDLLTHFIGEMERNGYGEIINQIRIGQKESYEDNDNERQFYSNRGNLRYYLREAISILENRSSKHLPDIVSRINENIEAVEPITGFQVELINGEFYNLANLPNYDALIAELNLIRRELENE